MDRRITLHPFRCRRKEAGRIRPGSSGNRRRRGGAARRDSSQAIERNENFYRFFRQYKASGASGNLGPDVMLSELGTDKRPITVRYMGQVPGRNRWDSDGGEAREKIGTLIASRKRKGMICCAKQIWIAAVAPGGGPAASGSSFKKRAEALSKDLPARWLFGQPSRPDPSRTEEFMIEKANPSSKRV